MKQVANLIVISLTTIFYAEQTFQLDSSTNFPSERELFSFNPPQTIQILTLDHFFFGFGFLDFFLFLCAL